MSDVAPPVKRNGPGRPRLAPSVTEISVLLPTRLYDTLCAEALSRSVSLSVVIREALIQSRRARGEWA